MGEERCQGNQGVWDTLVEVWDTISLPQGGVPTFYIHHLQYMWDIIQRHWTNCRGVCDIEHIYSIDYKKTAAESVLCVEN